MVRIFSGVLVLVLLAGCGKESSPVYRDKNGETPPPYSYPPPYGAQKQAGGSGVSGPNVSVSGRVRTNVVF